MLDILNARLGPRCDSGFDHSFAAGEITVVLGANQSGKTDLCRLVAGLHTVATGDVQLDGESLTGAGPRERPVGMVYQDFVNYPNLTVADNIGSPLRARGTDRASRDALVRDIAGKLHIAELLERYPHELSGGQQQRVAIARALARQPRVLLLDEPLVNLDFKLREALEVELKDLLKMAESTVVIYTSSDPRDAFNIADRLLLLQDGQMLQHGTPIEVYNAPANFAAMELLAEPAINRFERQGATVALRPEHVAIGPPEPASDALEFAMLVNAFETNGDESFVHGSVEEREWVIRCRGMPAIETGTRIEVHARPADVVGF